MKELFDILKKDVLEKSDYELFVESFNRLFAEDSLKCIKTKTNEDLTDWCVFPFEDWKYIKTEINEDLTGWYILPSEDLKCIKTETNEDGNGMNKNKDLDLKRIKTETNEDGRTLLYLAVSKGFLDITKFLVSQGMNIHEKDEWNRTFLHMAVMREDLNMLKFLLTQNLDINAKNVVGNTALHIASSNENLEMIETLITEGRANLDVKNDKNGTPLHQASANGNFDVVKLLVTMKANVNVFYSKNQGMTQENHKHAVLGNGTIFIQHREVMTPLKEAVTNGHREIEEFLRSQGAREIGESKTQVNKRFVPDSEPDCKLRHISKDTFGLFR